MKKFTVVLFAMILCASLAFPASAAVPTSLTFEKASKAPTLDGVIDAEYGSSVFDLKATDLKLGDTNLATTDAAGNTTRGGIQTDLDRVQAEYNVMHSIGYAVYDSTNLYLAFDVTDTYPKAASNSSRYWDSTNIQLAFYINQQLCFPTIAYSGTNKVSVIGDKRSEMDVSKIKTSFAENGGKFVYELVIPWSACPEVKTAEDVDDLRFGFVQTSMANGYLCAAFGNAYDLQYDKLLSVTMNQSSSNGNTSSAVQQGNESQDAESQSTASVNVGSGVEIGGQSETASVVSDGQEDQNTKEETSKKSNPLIPVLIIVAAVVVVGGVIAVVLLNKKPKNDTSVDTKDGGNKK